MVRQPVSCHILLGCRHRLLSKVIPFFAADFRPIATGLSGKASFVIFLGATAIADLSADSKFEASFGQSSFHGG
jgi:hypothetical protein